MGDDSSRSIVRALKIEWSLFWEAFQKEDKEILPAEKLEVMSLEQARDIARSLSNDRKLINQKLESLTKEIDLNTAKLEGLRLVGASLEDTLKRIEELNDLGQTMATSLEKVDEKIRKLRDRENTIRDSELAIS